MPRKKPPEDHLLALGVRVPRALWDAIDAEIALISPQGFQIARSDMVRKLLEEAIEMRRQAREKPPKPRRK